jgi:hypothetical protein
MIRVFTFESRHLAVPSNYRTIPAGICWHLIYVRNEASFYHLTSSRLVTRLPSSGDIVAVLSVITWTDVTSCDPGPCRVTWRHVVRPTTPSSPTSSQLPLWHKAASFYGRQTPCVDVAAFWALLTWPDVTLWDLGPCRVIWRQFMWPKHSSPNCAWSLLKISEGMAPSFVRNLITIRCATLLDTVWTAILIAPDGWGGEGPD